MGEHEFWLLVLYTFYYITLYFLLLDKNFKTHQLKSYQLMHWSSDPHRRQVVKCWSFCLRVFMDSSKTTRDSTHWLGQWPTWVAVCDVCLKSCSSGGLLPTSYSCRQATGRSSAGGSRLPLSAGSILTHFPFLCWAHWISSIHPLAFKCFRRGSASLFSKFLTYPHFLAWPEILW